MDSTSLPEDLSDSASLFTFESDIYAFAMTLSLQDTLQTICENSRLYIEIKIEIHRTEITYSLRIYFHEQSSVCVKEER